MHDVPPHPERSIQTHDSSDAHAEHQPTRLRQHAISLRLGPRPRPYLQLHAQTAPDQQQTHQTRRNRQRKRQRKHERRVHVLRLEHVRDLLQRLHAALALVEQRLAVDRVHGRFRNTSKVDLQLQQRQRQRRGQQGVAAEEGGLVHAVLVVERRGYILSRRVEGDDGNALRWIERRIPTSLVRMGNVNFFPLGLSSMNSVVVGTNFPASSEMTFRVIDVFGPKLRGDGCV